MLALSWLAIAVATLTPTAQVGEDLPFGCVVCGSEGGIDALANVLLFVPLGVGLALSGTRPTRALVLVALTTLGVELLQLRFIAGRDTSLGDLVWNTVGGAAGFWAVRRWRDLVAPGGRIAAALLVVWTSLWVIGTATTAWSLAPSLFTRWRWVAHVGAPERVRGPKPDVLAARLGDTPLRTGWVADEGAIRGALLGGEVLDATAAVPVGTPRLANLVVVDEARSGQVIASLQRSGSGAAYYLRTRAAVLQLRSPTLVLPGAFAVPGDTVRLRGAREPRSIVVEAASRRGTARAVAHPSPNWGWTLLLPPRLSRTDRLAVYTALWIGVFVFPIGYWAAQVGGLGGRAVALPAVIAPPVALAVIPAVAGLAPVAWTEYAAWAAATALGLGLGSAVRRRRARRLP